MEGFISIHRSLLEWEWWEDHNTTRLFIYLLIKANFKDKKWQGIEVKRGQLICSYDKIKKETGLSVMKIRTSLKKLKTTDSITIKTTSKYTMITVCKYDSYQLLKKSDNKPNNKPNNNPVTSQQQTNNKQITTTNNDNNNNNEKNVKNSPPLTPPGVGEGESFEYPIFNFDWENDPGKFIDYCRDYAKALNPKFPLRLSQVNNHRMDLMAQNKTIAKPKQYWNAVIRSIVLNED